MKQNWEEFAVVTARGSIPNKVGWHPASSVFGAETCSRHIYVGTKDAFEDIPDAFFTQPKGDGRRLREALYVGADAYGFLTTFVTGLDGHYLIDDHVSGQVARAWSDFVENSSGEHKKLQPYVSGIFADAALIKTSLLSQHLSRPTPISTAVRMAKLTPDDGVLVIGGAKDLSVETLTALGHKKRYTPNVVTLTHPCPTTLKTIADQIEGFGKKRAIKADLEVVPFEAIFENQKNATNLFNAASVFVCQPMREDALNQRLVDTWQQRMSTTQGTLFHLKGNPQARGQTTAPWHALETGFIDVPAIVEKNNERRETIQHAVTKAKEAIEHFGNVRLNNDRVAALSLQNKAGDMTLTYTLARRPRGCTEALASPSALIQQHG